MLSHQSRTLHLARLGPSCCSIFNTVCASKMLMWCCFSLGDQLKPCLSAPQAQPPPAGHASVKTSTTPAGTLSPSVPSQRQRWYKPLGPVCTSVAPSLVFNARRHHWRAPISFGKENTGIKNPPRRAVDVNMSATASNGRRMGAKYVLPTSIPVLAQVSFPTSDWRKAKETHPAFAAMSNATSMRATISSALSFGMDKVLVFESNEKPSSVMTRAGPSRLTIFSTNPKISKTLAPISKISRPCCRSFVRCWKSSMYTCVLECRGESAKLKPSVGLATTSKPGSDGRWWILRCASSLIRSRTASTYAFQSATSPPTQQTTPLQDYINLNYINRVLDYNTDYNTITTL